MLCFLKFTKLIRPTAGTGNLCSVKLGLSNFEAMGGLCRFDETVSENYWTVIKGTHCQYSIQKS